jgi:hypothetical protein
MSRKINGKTYNSFMTFKKKSGAVKVAKGYRTRGGRAIVVPIKKKYSGRTYNYGVYTAR